MRRLFAVLSVVAIGAAQPASATTIFPYQETCPVGGEQFETIAYGSYTTFGARLDGRPYGTSPFPLDVPVCPSNGFVMYKAREAYTPAQIEALTAYVASDYRALASEPTHYRAAHLARVAGEPVSTQAWLMLQASWQVDGDADRSVRFQREFIVLADAAAVQSSPAQTEWWMLQFRAANAERQLGDFDRATARLDALPLDRLDRARNGEREDSDFGAGYRRGLELLRSVIAQRDASVEPEAARPRRR